MDNELIGQLWTRAAGHCRSAQKLIANASTEFAGRANVDKIVFNGPYSASVHLLVGFSFELTLKAAFLLHGGSAERLWRGNRAIGHNLTKALDAAELCGFRSSVKDLRWTIERLTQSHLEHHFRYGGKQEIVLPGLETSIPMLNALVNEVGQLALNAGAIVRSR